MDNQNKGSKTIYLVLAAGIGMGSLGTAAFVVNKSNSPQTVLTRGFEPRTVSAPLSGETLSGLKSLDASFVSLAEFATPAVVDIKSISGRSTTADGRMAGPKGGEGSGFIYRADGYIITNDHVVGGYDQVTVNLKDGREFKGKVYRAEDYDLAVVKIDAKDLPTLALADSNRSKAGQLCMAVGAPFGFENSVAFGHVSAIGRDRTTVKDRSAAGDRYYSDLIQTDTPINMGNSGGPLIDVDGRVIGVNTLIYSPSGTSAGLGFAIPSNQVRMIADTLIKSGKISRAMIGFIPQNLKEYELTKLKLDGGAKVEELSPGGPAERAGLNKGDIITKIADTPIKSQVDLRSSMLVYPAGRTVNVEYVRDGQKKSTQIKLEEYKRPRQAIPSTPEPSDPGQELDIDQFMKNMPNMQRRRQNNSDAPTQPRTGTPRLGVTISDATETVRKQFGIPAEASGAVIMGVEPGSIAENLGLREGDVVTKFDGKTVSTGVTLSDLIKSVKWGDQKSISFTRFGKNSRSTMTLDAIFR